MKYIIVGNGQEWCYYSWKAAINENVVFYNDIASIIKNHFLGSICSNHFSKKNVTDHLSPIRKIWYCKLLKSLGVNNDSVIVFYDYGLLARDLDFISYIRRRCPHAKLIYMFSNIVRISGARKHGILDKLLNHYDQVFAFDPKDSLDYGFDFSPLIYTRDPAYEEKEILYDIFYVGNAKDRLNVLHDIYKRCIDSDLKCCFYINGVPLEKQLFPDIHYNSILSYSEVLDYMSHSRCMVDAIQGGSSAMTIKVSEAVLYDKKLITTNESIKNECYYSPLKFLVYDNKCDIKRFVDGEDAHFTAAEKGEFSPEVFFKKIRM